MDIKCARLISVCTTDGVCDIPKIQTQDWFLTTTSLAIDVVVEEFEKSVNLPYYKTVNLYLQTTRMYYTSLLVDGVDR